MQTIVRVQIMGRADKITGAAISQNTPLINKVLVVTDHTAIARGQTRTPEIARTTTGGMARHHRANGVPHTSSSHMTRTGIKDEHHAIKRMETDHSSVTTTNEERQM